MYKYVDKRWVGYIFFPFRFYNANFFCVRFEQKYEFFYDNLGICFKENSVLML